MAQDGTELPRCDPEIARNGIPLVWVVGDSAQDVEDWVGMVAAEAEARMGWRYEGGRARVMLHPADKSRFSAVLVAIRQLRPSLNGMILGYSD